MLLREPMVGARRAGRVLRGPQSRLHAAAFGVELIPAMVVFAYGNSYLVTVLREPESYPAFALATYGGVRLLVAAPAGWAVDHVRPALSAACALVLQAAGLGVMALVPSGEGYILGVAPLAAGLTLAWLLVLRALSAEVEVTGRGTVTAQLTFAGGLGLALGFAAAGVLSEYATAPSVFLFGLAVVGAYTLPLARARRRPARAARPASSGPPAGVSATQLVVAALGFLHFAAVASAVVAVAPFALTMLGMTLLETAIAIMPGILAGGAGMMLMGQRSRTGRRLRETWPLYLFAALAVSAAALTSEALWFVLATIPLGAAVGGSSPLLTAMKIDVAHAVRAPGTVLGRLSVADGLGSSLGPLAVGFVIEASGVRGGMLAVAAVFAATALLAGGGVRFVRL